MVWIHDIKGTEMQMGAILWFPVVALHVSLYHSSDAALQHPFSFTNTSWRLLHVITCLLFSGLRFSSLNGLICWTEALHSNAVQLIIFCLTVSTFVSCWRVLSILTSWKHSLRVSYKSFVTFLFIFMIRLGLNFLWVGDKGSFYFYMTMQFIFHYLL